MQNPTKALTDLKGGDTVPNHAAGILFSAVELGIFGMAQIEIDPVCMKTHGEALKPSRAFGNDHDHYLLTATKVA